MTLRHLRIFVIVCNEHSITNASKKLFISQPAVSTAIKEIEEYYNIKLFDRVSKKLYLTNIGTQIYDYASHITTLFDNLEDLVKSPDSTNTLRIGSSITIGTYLLPDYIKTFQDKYPTIRTLITIDSSDLIEQMVLNNELDFGLIEGVVHSNSLIHNSFMEDELVVIVPNHSPLLEIPNLKITDLKNENFLMREKNSGTRELAESFLLLHDISITPIWNSTSTKAIVYGVSKGLGISILPKKLVEPFMEQGIISILPINNQRFTRQFHIIYHKNKYLSKAYFDFFELVNQNYQN
ncbi:LysR family transcriptional regulator [Anaeromicropila herbilytica]|uniref:LysR family transcriptional regulator n=1 Tax=Anaeromicropila herbilytica TaxID=2785025 RepID=A0A7R7EM28_9FIRM|nr:LysR family transcriptional regulator [Anaeromicropila herbilytica]BCN31287.1 LysR family transcriptional regulator [Anaeromicropila herbilytica]